MTSEQILLKRLGSELSNGNISSLKGLLNIVNSLMVDNTKNVPAYNEFITEEINELVSLFLYGIKIYDNNYDFENNINNFKNELVRLSKNSQVNFIEYYFNIIDDTTILNSLFVNALNKDQYFIDLKEDCRKIIIEKLDYKKLYSL